LTRTCGQLRHQNVGGLEIMAFLHLEFGWFLKNQCRDEQLWCLLMLRVS
jgi:hypothetical protein